MNRKIILLTLFFGLGFYQLDAQAYLDLIQNPTKNTTLQEIQTLAEAYFEDKDKGRGSGYKQYKRWEYHMERHVNPDGKIQNHARRSWDLVQKLNSANPPVEKSIAGTWTNLGPSSFTQGNSGYNGGVGRVNVIAFHPTDFNTVYLGAPAGGVWKTTDGGATWAPLSDMLASIGISGIAVDHSNPNTIYILTGDGDGGNTQSIGILKSTDGGATWAATGLSWGVSSFNRGYKLLMHPTNSLIMLAATTVGLLKTTDGWATWTTEQAGSFRDIEFKPFDPTTVYACTTSDFYKSTDTGDNWTLISTGLPTGENRSAIAVTPGDSDLVYYLAGPGGSGGSGTYKGLYLSSNSGTTFSTQSTTPNILGNDLAGGGTSDQSWYDLAIAASPTIASITNVGGVNVWRSIDSGVNHSITCHWNQNTVAANPPLQYVHADIHELVYQPGTETLWCGSDGGISKSLNDGVTWTNLWDGLEIMQFYRIDGVEANQNLLIGGTQDNGSNLYTGTPNIEHILGGDGMDCMIDYVNNNNLFYSFQNGGLVRSTDGGDNWTFIQPGGSTGAWVTPYAMDPADPTIIYGGYSDVYRSTNSGTSWTNLGSDGRGAFAVGVDNPARLYASNGATIQTSANTGGLWTTISAGLPGLTITFIALDPLDADRVWVTLAGYIAGEKVYESTDAGATWTNISGTLPNVPALSIAYQNTGGAPADAIYVGMDVGVYYRSDVTPWTLHNTGLPNSPIYDLEINHANSKIRAGTFGRSIWETPLFVAACTVTATAVATNETCLGAGDGTITVTAQAVGCNGTLEYSLDAGPFQPSNVFTGVAAGAHTVTVRCSTDPACSTTITATVGAGVACGIAITDPCSCLDNATIIDLDAGTGGDDGTFAELVAITGPAGGMLPAGLTFQVSASSGAFDAFNVPPVGSTSPMVPIPVGTQLVYNANTGHYEIPFVHVDALGYSISVQQVVAGVPVGPVLSISNACVYPNPVFSPALADQYCANDPAVTLGGSDPSGLGADAVSFTIDGNAATQLDPGALSNGDHTVVMTWDGAAGTNNGSGTVANPNQPGCVQSVQKVINVDAQPPVITCPANVTIECDASSAPANTGTATATDNVTPNPIITFNDVVIPGACPQASTINRTWTATDGCGNSSTCLQVITVVDTTPPVITCPANVSISCTASTDPSATGTATAIDNCAATNQINITSSDVSTQTTTGCGQFTYTITRTWKATDPCGNMSTCVQIISVADTQAPVITCAPGQTLTCFESVPNPINTAAGFIAAGGTISDNCTIALSDFTVFSTQVDNGGSNCPGDARIVTRTYYVLDACGNSTTCTQTFTYLESTQGPVITSVLPTCYKYCGSLANPADSDITYTTDCSFGATVNIAGPTIIGQANCPGTIYRFTYTVTDDCGRTSAPVTRDFIIGNDGPTIECPSYSLLLECGDANNTAYINEHLSQVSANTSCELGYTITHFPSNFNNITCNTATVVTFVATDDCGRTATCTTVINISDNTAPVITSTYVDGVCNEAICGSNLNFWFANWKSKVLEGLSATDACDSNIQWTTSPNSNSPNQDCPDGTAATTVTWFANDNCGNAGEISYTFYVVPAQGPDPTGQIMGIVANEETETVEDVVVSLEGNGNEESFQTAEDGIYNFADLQLEENYTVTPYLNANPLNGISSFDLVLIAKHILQSELLDSPYKIIAADINKSGSVTTVDIVELRKLILHINEEFPDNTSWRFIESAFVFPEPTNPFATIFPEAVYINGLTEEEQHDFVAVKVGDVNGSAVANAMAGAEDRTFVDDLVFNIADQELKAGESYEVTFRTDNFNAIHGYQFSLNFDEAALKFAGISTGELTNLSESNFGLTLLDKGVITTSWTNQQGQSLARNAEVFHVTFVAKADAFLSEVISVSSRYTKAEAYNGNLDLMGVQLRFDGDDEVTNGFRLYQNTPNPFKQETVIGFELPEVTKATLNIYDVSGKLVNQVEGEFAKGYNSISISQEGLPTGVLYYELVTPSHTARKKMIRQRI